MASDWVFVAIGLLLLTHLVILAYAFRNHRGPNDSHSHEDAWETVTCPDCGESNEPTYRYCGHCVTELPTRGSSLARQQTDSTRRTM